jgi:tight adherence protein C
MVKRRIGSRQHDILRALPDALDMLTICVDAGLAFDLAMLKIGEKWDNTVAREFNRVVAEIRMGLTREDALRRMVERTGVVDIGNFVAVLIQADQLGVSIADVLHVQSSQMRVRRHQRAEELANQAPVKMVFPLVFLILPALFIMILGPALPRMADALSAMGGG